LNKSWYSDCQWGRFQVMGVDIDILRFSEVDFSGD
jgi:hypothetical protein